MRRPDGAYRWGVYRDLEDAERYVETFLVSSWAEHLRRHERTTKADRYAEVRLRTYVTVLRPSATSWLLNQADGRLAGIVLPLYQ